MIRALLVVAGFALLVALAPSADAAKRTNRVEVVCFKKTVFSKPARKKVRRTVCRPRRKAVKAAPTPAPFTPAPVLTPPPPAPIPAASEPAPVQPPAAPAPTAACVAQDTEWLMVRAYDVDQQFKLAFSRTCLKAGRTIVQYKNEDAQPHNLFVEGVAPAAPRKAVVGNAEGETMEQADVQLSAGTWRFFCDIEGHETMSRTLTVTPG